MSPLIDCRIRIRSIKTDKKFLKDTNQLTTLSQYADELSV